MLNFNFYNPTRIIFGRDTIAKINDYVPTEAKVLMLFGGESARKNGTLAEVREYRDGYVERYNQLLKERNVTNTQQD